jgi:hypothetical protein
VYRRRRRHGLVVVGIAVVHERHPAARHKRGCKSAGEEAATLCGPSTLTGPNPRNRHRGAGGLSDSEVPASCRGSCGAARTDVAVVARTFGGVVEVGSAPMQMAVTKLPHGNKGEHRTGHAFRRDAAMRAKCAAAVARAALRTTASLWRAPWCQSTRCNLTTLRLCARTEILVLGVAHFSVAPAGGVRAVDALVGARAVDVLVGPRGGI